MLNLWTNARVKPQDYRHILSQPRTNSSSPGRPLSFGTSRYPLGYTAVQGPLLCSRSLSPRFLRSSLLWGRSLLGPFFPCVSCRTHSAVCRECTEHMGYWVPGRFLCWWRERQMFVPSFPRLAAKKWRMNINIFGVIESSFRSIFVSFVSFVSVVPQSKILKKLKVHYFLFDSFRLRFSATRMPSGSPRSPW